MRQYLAALPSQQHANKGMRKELVKLMEGGAEAYEGAFREARMGKTFPRAYTERARIARVAELFPQDFERISRGLGSERVSVAGRSLRKRGTCKRKVCVDMDISVSQRF